MSLPPNPFTPPPGEKVYLENEFSLLHFLINEWNVCFAILNCMFVWLVLATPGQAPIEEVTDLLGICNKIRRPLDSCDSDAMTTYVGKPKFKPTNASELQT